MPKLDPFAAELVRLVRAMPDEEILALVRDRLSVAPPSPAAPDGEARRKRTTTRPPPSSAGPNRTPRQLLAVIEDIVSYSSGLSVRQVARAARVSQEEAEAALEELKQLKRIFQGGERGFERYAGTALLAEAASLVARDAASDS